MRKNKKGIIILISIILLCGIGGLLFYKNKETNLPLIAIANYGPHSSLEESIIGLKNELSKAGYIEDNNVRYVIEHVSFDQTLINQMITKLKILKPKVIVAISTPVAQSAKNLVKDIPLVYSVVTDPVEAGLIKEANRSNENVTGSSEKQNLNLLLKFSKEILPNSTKVGLIYSTSEINDTVLLKMLKNSASEMNMEVVAVPVDQPREVQQRMQLFNSKVDFIYLGASSVTLPVLPAIVSEANKMKIPVFSADSQDVKNNHVLGSFGVNYYQVGVNAGKIVSKIMQGEVVANINPIYPSEEDHKGFLSKQKLNFYNINNPILNKNISVVD